MSFEHRIDYIFIHNIRVGLGTSNSFGCPMRFIVIELYLRPYSLVVEPFPSFRNRNSAADYPLVHRHHFQTLTLTVSSYVVVDEALGSSSNSPSDTLIRYQIRRPVNVTVKVVKHFVVIVEIEPTLLVMLVLRLSS